MIYLLLIIIGASLSLAFLWIVYKSRGKMGLLELIDDDMGVYIVFNAGRVYTSVGSYALHSKTIQALNELKIYELKFYYSNNSTQNLLLTKCKRKDYYTINYKGNSREILLNDTIMKDIFGLREEIYASVTH